MSKAASALYVTQHSLSRAVGELEAELGTVLFERANRGVRLTPKGGESLFYARMMLAQEQTLRYRFQREQKQESLRFSVVSQHFGFVAAAFAGLMERLRGQGCTLKLRDGKSVEALEAVSSGALDRQQG